MSVCQTKDCGKPATKRCSACSCAYYCSIDCQKADWEEHNRVVCSLWKGPGERVFNPWFAHVSPKYPATIPYEADDELFEAARTGNLIKVQECIDRGAKVGSARSHQGESSLHFAVMSGSIPVVELLLKAGAYINSTDWRNANVIYYCCTHPDVPANLRLPMIEFLVANGADTMEKSSFSGKRPFEAASDPQIRAAIENSKLHRVSNMIRNSTNEKHPGKIIAICVRRRVDLQWRVVTATWRIQVNRDVTLGSVMPHPQSVGLDIEEAFHDCQRRHLSLLSEMKNIANAML